MSEYDNVKRQPEEAFLDYQIRLGRNRDVLGISWSEIAILCNSQPEIDDEYTESKWRKDIQSYLRVYDHLIAKDIKSQEPEFKYKETVEILGDGSHKSDKLLRMSAEQSKDIDYLLDAHGYDKNEWELTSARSNIWNVYSKQDGIQSLYSSKVTVKPKKNGFDIDKLVERLNEREPIVVDVEVKEIQPKLLEVPLYDMHFGVSSLTYYLKHLKEIVNKIESRHWDKVLFVIGNDLLHNDNFKSSTANGTQIEKVDMEKAFDEAESFYETIIKKALKNSNNVECVYVKGNHDESMSYGLFRALKNRFPQVEFESSLKQRKAFIWEKIFIGLTHGDKGANRMMKNFMSDYGKLIANAEVREIHAGHIHTEKTKDDFGLVQRNLATANKTDDWHDDNGFVGANKRFQLFEYSPTALDAIYYVQ